MNEVDQPQGGNSKPEEHRLVVLISIPARGEANSETDMPMIGGRSLASHQLDFALACGAGQVVALGDGSSATALALRHQAEAADLQFSIASGPHSLAGIIRDEDWALVMQEGLLALNSSAIAAVRNADGERVLTLSSGAGTHAGFERIDLERAWAGLMLLDAKRMEGLLSLPEDCDPFPALLRIALQARLPEVQLRERALSDGSWVKVRPDSDMISIEEAWLARVIPEAKPTSVSSYFSMQMFKRLGRKLMPASKSLAAIVAAGSATFAGAIACIWFEYFAGGFLLLALGTPLFTLANNLVSVSYGPFTPPIKPRWSASKSLAVLPDAALAACCILAIDAEWFLQIYPPLLLLVLLRSEEWRSTGGFRALLTDRVLIACLLAVSALVGLHEIMIGFIALMIGGSRVVAGLIGEGQKTNEAVDKFEG